MYLLLQLHAPVDDYDRSLYVFGCNNNACHSYRDESDDTNTIKRFHPCIGIDSPLRCFRSQTSWTATADSSKTVSSSKTKNVDLVDNDWGLDDDNASGGWGDDGDDDDDWGGDNTDKDVSMNDLEDMLTKCEMQSSSKKIEQKQQPQTAKASQPSSKDSDKSMNKQVNNAPSFEYYDLDMFNEPYSSQTNDSDDEEDDGNVDSSRVDQMLSRYLDMEDDEEILSVLKGGDTNNSSSNDNNDKGGGGERYERLPPEERALLAFTNRLKCAPNQVEV